ncbi:MAG: InlB B-repeat-containing protein [Clostridiales Family XIII bacterium]|nr:InlB B-repeat-containing protein [Clostridiales Family XIII bacterium]
MAKRGKKSAARMAVVGLLTAALLVGGIPLGAGLVTGNVGDGGASPIAAFEKAAGFFTAEAAAKKVKVLFDANGGTVSKESAKYKVGAKFKGLPKASRTNYEFKGWYTKKKGGKRIADGARVKFKKTTTLFAHWTPVKVSAEVRGMLGKTFKSIDKNEGGLTYVKTAGKQFGKISAVEPSALVYVGVADYYEFKSKGKAAASKDKCVAVHTTPGALFPKFKEGTTCEKLAKRIGGTYKGYELTSAGKSGAHYYQFFKYKTYGIIIDYYSKNKEKDVIPTEGAMCVIYRQW